MLPVALPWNDFEFLDSGIIFSQQGSSKMLFSQLPLQGEEGSGVFLFGSHNSECRGPSASSIYSRSPLDGKSGLYSYYQLHHCVA